MKKRLATIGHDWQEGRLTEQAARQLVGGRDDMDSTSTILPDPNPPDNDSDDPDAQTS